MEDEEEMGCQPATTVGRKDPNPVLQISGVVEAAMVELKSPSPMIHLPDMQNKKSDGQEVENDAR